MNIIYARIYVTCNIFIALYNSGDLYALEPSMKRQSCVNMCKLQV